MIEVIDLKLHLDSRGWLFEGWENPAYWYATSVFPGVVKGWHRHAKHTDRLCCVSGLARIVALWVEHGEPDMGPGSLVTSCYQTREIVCGPMQPKVVIIPPGIWHAFTAIGGECVIVNSPDMPYDPDDEEREGWDYFPYEWVANG